MANLGTAYVQIVPSAQGIEGSITNALGPESQRAGQTAGKSIATNIGGALTKTGGLAMKAGGVATALSLPLVAGIKKSMGAYNIQNAAETKLTEIYKTRMGVSDQAAKSTMALASALQQEGVVGDEVTLSGAQQLATFAKYPDTVNSLLPAMSNLLVQQKGVNASQSDAVSVANMMGKVMSGQVEALKRVGITFDENSEKILKNGTEQEKAAELAKVITQNVGNMNSEFAKTDAGKMQQMNNAMGDLSEKAGGVFAPILSNLAQQISEQIIPKVSDFLDFLAANPALANVIVGIAGVLAIGGPLLVMIGAVITAVGTITTALAGLTLAALAPVAAVAGIAAALALMWANSETLRNAVSQLTSALGAAFAPILQTIGQHIMNMVPIVMQFAGIIGDVLGVAIKMITPIITMLVNVLGSYLGPMFSVIEAKIKTFVAGLQIIGKVVGPIFSSLATKISSACQTITKVLSFSGLSALVKGVFNKVKSGIQTAVNSAKNKVSSVVSSIKSYMKFSTVKEAAQKAFNAAKDAISKAIGNAKKAVDKAVKDVVTFLKFDGVKDTVSKVFEDIKKGISDKIDAAKDAVEKVVNKIKKFFPINVGNIFKGIIPKISLSASKSGNKAETKSSVSHENFAKAMKNPYMFRERTQFYAGERGDEMLYGHKALMRDIREAAGGGRSGGNVVVNLNYDAGDDASEMLRDLVRGIKRYKMAGAI